MKRTCQVKFISKLLVILLLSDLFAFTDSILNNPVYASPIIDSMNISTTENEVSVYGSGNGNGVSLADKPFRYSIGSSQSEWVRDSGNITVNETLTSGALSNTQAVNNSLQLSTAPTGGATLNGYTYGDALAIDHTKIDSALTNFPVTVYLDDNNFDFSKAKPDGSDILFTDVNLNPLIFEKEEHYISNTNTYTFDTIIPDEITNVNLDSMIINNGKLTLSDSYASSNTLTSQYANLNCNLEGDFEVSVDLTENMISINDYIKSDALAIVTSSGEIISIVFNDAWTNSGVKPSCVICTESTTLYNSGSGFFTSSGDYNFKIKRSNGVISFYTSKSSNALTTYNNSEEIIAVRLCTQDKLNGYSYEPAKFDNLKVSDLNPPYNGKAVYNVLLPTVSNLTDTRFYLWYGNQDAYNKSIEAWQDQTGKQLAYNGNVKLVHGIQAGKKAAAFDGTGDYFSLEDSNDWNFGSGNFCIEFKMLFNSLSTTQFLYDQTTDTDNHMCLSFNLTRGLRFVVKSGGTVSLDSYTGSPGSVSAGTIQDIAIVRNGSAFTIYQNGIAVKTATASITLQNYSNLVRLGISYLETYGFTWAQE